MKNYFASIEVTFMKGLPLQDYDSKYVGSNRLLAEYSNVVKTPKGTVSSSTVFMYVYLKDVQCWCTQFKEGKEWKMIYDVIHPYMKLKEKDVRSIKSFLNQELNNNHQNPPVIECSYHLKFNVHHINQNSGKVIDSDRVLIKASPATINKSSWHDWIKVSYGDDGYGYGQVRLVLKICWNESSEHYGKSIEQRLYLLTHMHENFVHEQNNYHFLPCMKVDKICRKKSYIVPFESIDSTAAVVSAVKFDNRHKYLSREHAEEYFENNNHNHFVILPPTEEWYNIGWDEKELRATKKKVLQERNKRNHKATK